MTPREIIGELGEALGLCDQSALLRRINRAVELLANKDLFDPLIGYLNFQVTEGNFIALPREVRSVLAVNLNNQPAFARTRFYEFDLNTAGTVTGDSVEWEWNDRANVVVQDERKLPGLLSYRCVDAGDNGKTCRVEGRNFNGRTISETLVASSVTPAASTNAFHEIIRVYREETAGECLLYSNGELLAQYYGDETEPVYRSIRLSRSVVSVRIMFRREPLRITTLDSYIPLNSPMAVIQAAKAVGHLTTGEDDKADMCLARAEKFIAEDQSSREEGDKMAAERQVAGTIGAGLGYSEGIAVLDVYDTAAEIFGRVGRNVLFKKITQAIQVLLNKAHWDGLLGTVDIWPRSNDTLVNPSGGTGHGYYVFPRFMGTPLKINLCGTPLVARNQWFDFHLNGTGERNTASANHWDDMGDTVLLNCLPKQAGTGYTIPTKVVAVCDNSLDEDKYVRIFGRERVSDGRVIEVWRDGKAGWICPCKPTLTDPGASAPAWVEVCRIERAETRGFVRLHSIAATPVPAVPATDQTTVSEPVVLNGTWTGALDSVRVYVAGMADEGTYVYADAERTLLIGQAASSGASQPGVFNAITFTVNGMTFTGQWSRTVADQETIFFQINRTYTPLVPASTSLVRTGLLGFWYPDEVEPSYRLIRLPSSHPKRIRVLYRRRFKRITSLYDHIPLRSSLAVENMLRALKAQELGLIEQAEPLELKAVQYLSEDRIKEGQSEMPTLEFDMTTAPGGWENIT